MVNIKNKQMMKALVEVKEILLKMDDDDFNKIPLEILDYIEANKDNSYIWKYEENLGFEEQKLSEYTLEILTYLCMEYILEGEEKKVAKEWFEKFSGKNDEKSNISFEKFDIYEPQKVIENTTIGLSQKEDIQDNIENLEKLPVPKKEKNIFLKIIERIKSFLRRK